MFLTLILITIAYIIIILLEVPYLVAQKMWRDMVAFSVLLIPAIIYSYGLALEIDLPNPTNIIEQVFSPSALWLEHVLGTLH